MQRMMVLWMGLLLGPACGAGQSASERAPSSARTQPEAPFAPASIPTREPRRGCPAETANARVSSENVHAGAALVFTTSEDVADLRQRVAALPLSSALPGAESHLDNIQDGVRLVFETNSTANVLDLQRRVEAQSRQIATRCGLVLAPPEAPTAEPAPAPETPPKVAPKPADDSKSKAGPADKKKKPNGKSGPHPETPKPAGKTKPAGEDKPAEPGKPPEKNKVKTEKKPVPRLPGVQPDPIN